MPWRSSHQCFALQLFETSQAMELTIRQEEGYLVATTSGSIDASADQLFRDQLHPLVREPGTKLILDITDSNYLSSPGISALVLLVTDANTCDSRVVLASPSSFVANVLHVTKLDCFFTTAESLEDAVKLLVASSAKHK